LVAFESMRIRRQDCAGSGTCATTVTRRSDPRRPRSCRKWRWATSAA